MDAKIHESDKVRVNLKNSEIYVGEVVDIAPNYIKINKVLAEHSNTRINAPITLFRDEVFKIHKITQNISENNEKEARVYGITEEELRCFTEMAANYVYLKNVDEEFESAISRLSNCENLGVACLGKSSLLVLSTYDQIYIIDLLKVGRKVEVVDKIKTIFESPVITKILYNSNKLRDYLKFEYNISIENVFDVGEAHKKLMNEENASLARIVNYHLNLPESLLETSLELQENDEVWQERPLFVNKKVYASQLVVYLWKLKQCLEKNILREYYEKINDEYLKHYKTNDLELLFQFNNIEINNIK